MQHTALKHVPFYPSVKYGVTVISKLMGPVCGIISWAMKKKVWGTQHATAKIECVFFLHGILAVVKIDTCTVYDFITK